MLQKSSREYSTSSKLPSHTHTHTHLGVSFWSNTWHWQIIRNKLKRVPSIDLSDPNRTLLHTHTHTASRNRLPSPTAPSQSPIPWRGGRRARRRRPLGPCIEETEAEPTADRSMEPARRLRGGHPNFSPNTCVPPHRTLTRTLARLRLGAAH